MRQRLLIDSIRAKARETIYVDALHAEVINTRRWSKLLEATGQEVNDLSHHPRWSVVPQIKMLKRETYRNRYLSPADPCGGRKIAADHTEDLVKLDNAVDYALKRARPLLPSPNNEIINKNRTTT